LLVDRVNEGTGCSAIGGKGVGGEAVGGIEVVGVIAGFREGDGWGAAAEDGKVDASANVKAENFQVMIPASGNISGWYIFQVFSQTERDVYSRCISARCCQTKRSEYLWIRLELSFQNLIAGPHVPSQGQGYEEREKGGRGEEHSHSGGNAPDSR